MKSIIQDLESLVQGEICNKPEILTEFSQDFGRVFQKYPQVIVRPQNVNDVVQTVKYAHEQGLIIAPRAAGHSLSGQSLSQDGIVLDLKSLNQMRDLNTDQLWFQADAGMTWGEVVDACVPKGVVPPVLTNYFGVTVGGTHSAGGLGAASFLNGSQADNCIGVEVVTAEGELVWCTPETNSELFYHVLCGYGQLGIITKVKHKLKKSPAFTRTYLLFYDELDALLQDQQRLVSEQRVHHLVSVPVPCLQGMSRNTGVIKPLIQWFYTLQISVETNEWENIDDQKIFSGLNFYRHIHTEDLGFEQFIQPIIPFNKSPELVNPWMDVLLPASKAQDYIETVLEQLPSFLDPTKTPMGCFCLFKHQHQMPMFSLPNEELIIGFGIYPTLPKEQLQAVLPQLQKFSDLSLDMGGKRYLTGVIEFNDKQWQTQFGDYWPKIQEIKQKYDPKGIFNSDFFNPKNLENVEETNNHPQPHATVTHIADKDRHNRRIKYAIALIVILFQAMFWGFLILNNFEGMKFMIHS